MAECRSNPKNRHEKEALLHTPELLDPLAVGAIGTVGARKKSKTRAKYSERSEKKINSTYMSTTK